MGHSMLITCVSYFAMFTAACCFTDEAQSDQISELVQVILMAMAFPDFFVGL